MMTFLLSGLFSMVVSGSAAVAAVVAEATPHLYICNLTVIADDLPGGFGEAKGFERFVRADGPHGGSGETFTFGLHEVNIQVDGRWRNLLWERDGKTVARVITAAEQVHTSHFALIAVDPANEDQQVSLDCAPGEVSMPPALPSIKP